MDALRPKTVVDPAKGTLVIGAPTLYDRGVVDQFASSRTIRVTNRLAALLWHEGTVDHDHHSLFGEAGHMGPQLVLLLIKVCNGL